MQAAAACKLQRRMPIDELCLVQLLAEAVVAQSERLMLQPVAAGAAMLAYWACCAVQATDPCRSQADCRTNFMMAGQSSLLDVPHANAGTGWQGRLVTRVNEDSASG